MMVDGGGGLWSTARRGWCSLRLVLSSSRALAPRLLTSRRRCWTDNTQQSTVVVVLAVAVLIINTSSSNNKRGEERRDEGIPVVAIVIRVELLFALL